MSLLQKIRARYHPLWRLRHFAGFRYLQLRLDFPIRRHHQGIPFYGLILRDFPTLLNPLAGDSLSCDLLDRLAAAHRLTHFFDLGANLGLFSWHVLHAAPATRFFLFEPDPANLRLLRRSLRANPAASVQLWAGAVAREFGRLEFLVDDASGATGSLAHARLAGGPLQTAYHAHRQISVAATHLDAYLDIADAASSHVVMKIDVEGAEAEVLAGARRFLVKFRPLILIECFHVENLEPLTQSGYITHRLDAFGNYLLVPREANDAIQQLLPASAQK